MGSEKKTEPQLRRQVSLPCHFPIKMLAVFDFIDARFNFEDSNLIVNKYKAKGGVTCEFGVYGKIKISDVGN